MMKWNPIRSLKQILKAKPKQEDYSLKNGALILEHLITSFNGNCLPFRIYSHQELLHATNGFEHTRILLTDLWWCWTLYKGHYENRMISVKKFDVGWHGSIERVLDMIANEISIASQICKHKNIVKFYGCCIETELPILVFEHIENGSYFTHFLGGGGGDNHHRLLPMEDRLRIASEVATAITFFHQGTSRIIIHGDVRPKNVYLDDRYGAKLGDFSRSMLIPLGEDHVQGERSELFFRYDAPEAKLEGRFTEKSDVYSFGATLFEIMTGKGIKELFEHTFDTDQVAPTYLDVRDDGPQNCLLQEIYLSLDDDSREMEKQLMDCAELTRMCLQSDSDLRPCMLDVAKSLISIRKEINAKTS